MTRRVALDLGTTDPSAARRVVARAIAEDPDLHVTVVGPRTDDGVDDDRVAWRAARPPRPEVDPAVAVRGQVDLSTRVALELGRDGVVDTVVSASPVPALLTGARFLLRRRTGVRDPLLAATLDTPTGPVVVLDVSGHGGTTAGSLGAVAADLLPLPDRIGLLGTGSRDDRLAAVLSDRTGTPVVPVTATEVLEGAAPLVLADGAAGGLLVDTVRALVPARVVANRVVGLDGPLAILVVAADPVTWGAALAAPVASS